MTDNLKVTVDSAEDKIDALDSYIDRMEDQIDHFINMFHLGVGGRWLLRDISRHLYIMNELDKLRKQYANL